MRLNDVLAMSVAVVDRESHSLVVGGVLGRLPHKEVDSIVQWHMAAVLAPPTATAATTGPDL